MAKRNTILASADGDTITIQILEEISSVWWSGANATSVARVLAENPNASQIQVDINTDGGDVFETLGMMSLLTGHPGRVVTTNMGKALSAGALLLQCGDERRASKASMMMIHRAWAFAVGNAEDLEHQADTLRKVDAQQVEILADRASVSAEEIGSMLDAETWLTTTEQLEHGLIDTILERPAAMACVRHGRFKNTPAELLAKEPQQPKAKTMPDKPEQPKQDTAKETAEAAAKAEQARILTIQTSGKKLGVDAATIAKHITDGTSVADFNATAIDAYEADRKPHVADGGRAPITAGDDARDKLRAEVSDWLLVKAGLAARVRRASKNQPDIEQLQGQIGGGGQFRGSSLTDLVRYAIGDDSKGRTKAEAVQRFLISASGGGNNTTADFSIAFENALHKAMLASYASTPSTWRRFVAVGPPAPDFRELPRYRKGFLSRLDNLNEHGEIKRKSLRDAAKETNQLETRANIVGITREALINDDMGFLASTAVDLGQAAERTLELIVYELLAENGGLGPIMSDTLPLFDAAHKNIGTPSAISIAALSADILQFKEQQDINGEDFLDLEPTKLLVPTALKFEAQKINSEANDFDSGSTVASRNMIQGAFDDVIDSPRLKATSATRRYLFADPDVAPVLEMIFLEGTSGQPVLEAMEQWNMLGREWRIYHDAAVGAIATEGALTNAGV